MAFLDLLRADPRLADFAGVVWVRPARGNPKKCMISYPGNRRPAPAGLQPLGNPMKNKNMVLFFVLSMILLGAYYLLTNRLNPPAPAAQVGRRRPPAPAPAAPAARRRLPASCPAPLFTQGLRRPQAHLAHQRRRPGAGGLEPGRHPASSTRKPRTRTASPCPCPSRASAVPSSPSSAASPSWRRAGGQTVTFASPAGDKLIYAVPDQGPCALRGVDSRQRQAASPWCGCPPSRAQVHNLGRVFTLDEKKIEAVTWSEMLSDPFFSFLGSSARSCPPPPSRVGLDAGLDRPKPTQTQPLLLRHLGAAFRPPCGSRAAASPPPGT